MAKNKPNRPQYQAQKPAAQVVEKHAVTNENVATIAPSFWLNTKLHKIIVFVFGCLLYVNTLGFDHSVDDAITITDNMHTQQGIAGIGGILGKDTFHGFFRDDKKLVEGGRYRPLSLVLFAVEMQFFGKPMTDKNGKIMKSPQSGDEMKGIAFIGHLGNMLLYGLTGILLYMVLLLLFQRNNLQLSEPAHIAALVGSLVFLAHPTHTEAVANIKGCDEILSLLGSLGALYLSLKAFYKNDFVLLIASGIVFFLGLMAKENTVTFLAIIPLALWFFSNPKINDLIKHTAPLLVGFVAFMLVRTAAIGSQFGNAPLELMNNPFVKLNETTRLYEPLGFGEHYGTIIYSLGKYLQLLVFPTVLTHDYYPRHIAIADFSNGIVLLSTAIYAALLGFAIWGTPRKNPYAFGVWLYLLSLSIVSNLVFPVGTNMAERFLYMPSVGFSLIVALFLTQVFKNKNIILGITAAICLLFGARSIVRNPVWYDNFTLFMADGNTSVNSAKLQNACGGELQRIAILTDKECKMWLDETSVPELVAIRALPDSVARRQQLLDLAVKHLDNTLRIHPTYGNAWLLKGNALYYQKKYPEAIAAYRECLRLQAEVANATKNMGCALRDYGSYLGQVKNDLPAAEVALAEAVKCLGNDDQTYHLYNVSLGMQRKFAETKAVCEQWIQKMPQSAMAHSDLAAAYNALGDAANANAEIQKAEALKR
jgi:protein O-mannosyl-transferase